MGIVLYIIVIIIFLIFLYYNRGKRYLYALLILLLIPPAELIYRYIGYKSHCIASSGLTVEKAVKGVDGFVYEGLEENCFACVAPFLVRLGYKYVDIADNNNIGDIADVYYRFEIAKKGSKSCKTFAKRTQYMTPEAIKTRFHIGPDQCLAREAIEENDTKYQLLKAVRRLPSGDRREFHKVRDRLTNERLAVSNSYLFGGGFLGWFWFAPGSPPYASCPDEGISLDAVSGDNLTKVLLPRGKP